MATVFLASELGDGLGHVARLLAVGRALAGRGHRIVLSVPDLIAAQPFIGLMAGVLQSPLPRVAIERAAVGAAAANYADILEWLHYDDPDALFALVSAWRRLFELEGADLVIADHAPTVCLAAAPDIPVVVVGTGFTVPPTGASTFPPLRSPMAATRDTTLAIAIAALQARRGLPVPPSLPAALAGSARFVCSSRELDPYADARTELPLGPLDSPRTPLPEPDRPRVFAYLSGASPRLEQLVLGLIDACICTSLYVRGAPRFLTPLLRGSQVELLERPPRPLDMMAGATLVVHHGGSLGDVALHAGRPQLLAPQHLEQDLTGAAVARLGVGTVIARATEISDVARAIGGWARDGDAMTRAARAGEEARARRHPDPLGAIVRQCEELIAGPPGR